MPINPYLLNQAAQGTPSPLASFVPAFQQAQDRKMKQELLQEERGMRLAKMKQDWTQYVQDQKYRKEKMDLDRDKLALDREKFEAEDEGGLDYNLQRVWNDKGDMMSIDPRNPQSISDANQKGYTFTSNPRTEDKDDGRIWAAYVDRDSGETLYGRFTDSEINSMREDGIKVSPSGTDPVKTAEGLSGDSEEMLGDKFVALNSLLRNGNKVLETASENPNSVGWAGNAARFGNAMFNNASRLIETVGIKDETSDKESFISSNKNLFGDVAKDNALLQALIYDIAYSYMAATKDQSGRGLSDQDVKYAINIISSDTPETLSNNLRYFLNESRNTFTDLFRARSGEDYKGRFGDFEPIWEPAPGGNMDESVQKQTPTTRRRYNKETGMVE